MYMYIKKINSSVVYLYIRVLCSAEGKREDFWLAVALTEKTKLSSQLLGLNEWVRQDSCFVIRVTTYNLIELPPCFLVHTHTYIYIYARLPWNKAGMPRHDKSWAFPLDIIIAKSLFQSVHIYIILSLSCLLFSLRYFLSLDTIWSLSSFLVSSVRLICIYKQLANVIVQFTWLSCAFVYH